MKVAVKVEKDIFDRIDNGYFPTNCNNILSTAQFSQTINHARYASAIEKKKVSFDFTK